MPVLYDWLLPDGSIPLYKEVAEENGSLKFVPDSRPKIVFKNPVTTITKKLMEGSLTGKLALRKENYYSSSDSMCSKHSGSGHDCSKCRRNQAVIHRKGKKRMSTSSYHRTSSAGEPRNCRRRID